LIISPVVTGNLYAAITGTGYNSFLSVVSARQLAHALPREAHAFFTEREIEPIMFSGDSMVKTLNGEYECRKCGRFVSISQYRRDRFCPNCKTLLRPRRQPKFWLFQFNPSIYRWFDWMKENKETEQWLVSRYGKIVFKEDKVAIWATGNKAGIYAIGEVLENPSERTLNPDQEKYWTKRTNTDKFLRGNSVTVKYLRVQIDTPIREEDCRKDPVLSTMENLKQPQGTNFTLTKEQWNRIVELFDD